MILEGIDNEFELGRTTSDETTDVQAFTLGMANSSNTALSNMIAKKVKPNDSIISALLLSQSSLIQLLVLLVTHIFSTKEKK